MTSHTSSRSLPEHLSGASLTHPCHSHNVDSGTRESLPAGNYASGASTEDTGKLEESVVNGSTTSQFRLAIGHPCGGVGGWPTLSPVVGEGWGTGRMCSRSPCRPFRFDLNYQLPDTHQPPSSSHPFPFAETVVKTHIPAKAPQIYHSTIEINSSKVSGRSPRFVILRIGERLASAASRRHPVTIFNGQAITDRVPTPFGEIGGLSHLLCAKSP